MPTYQVQTCNLEMTAGISRARMSGFWGDLHWRALWNIPLEELIANCAAREAWLLTKSRSNKRHQMVVDTETGEVVGYARWLVPDGMETMWLEAQVRQVTPEEEKRFKKQFDNSNWQPQFDGGNVDERIVQRASSLYGGKTLLNLEYLSVHPAHKGRGVASMLLRSGVEQIDAAGIGAWMIASPAGMNVYVKQGFKVVDTICEDKLSIPEAGLYKQHLLFREARKPE